MITKTQFLNGINANVARVKQYKLGCDGRDGNCDCIGLIIGAIRLAGGTWGGTHGSNYAARNEVNNLRYIKNASDLRVGEVVFKAKNPGDSNYSLPDSYKNSGDLKDYNHVGVVVSVNPLLIVHCTGVAGGIKRDNTLGNWHYAGELKKVNYEEGRSEIVSDETLYKARVTAINGNTVRMRSVPSESGAVLKNIPVNTEVAVLSEKNGWKEIAIDGQKGYMMSQFLMPVGSTAVNESKGVDMAALKAARNALAAALEALDKALR